MRFKEFTYKIDCDGRYKCGGLSELVPVDYWDLELYNLERFNELKMPPNCFLEFTIYNDSNLILLKILNDDDKVIKLIEYHSDYYLIKELFDTLDNATEKSNWQDNGYALKLLDGMTWEVLLIDVCGEIYRIKEPGNNIMYKRKISALVNKIVPKIDGKYNAFHLFDR